tara:strand:- start:1750 stop:1923 length:174 start_codon:yes stop_codon:yes gene_type:complete
MTWHSETVKGSPKKFMLLVACAEAMVDVGVALENDNLLEAVKNDDFEEVKRILNEEF